MDGSRIRAYSVGSQASSQRKVNSTLVDKDPRTGAKSSSAPLLNNRPPRVRSSVSRGEVGEDLMEIDYNKTKYSAAGIDLLDSFTIEPVGRARSGSYSSSSNSTALKVLHNRDKIKSQSTGHSSSSIKDDSTDYLTMSPLTDNSRSVKMSKSEEISKKSEMLHPPGDYVSLDPSCTYKSGEKVSSEKINYHFENQPKGSDCDSAARSKESFKRGDGDGQSDYLCMNYEQNSVLRVLPSANSHSPQSDEKELEQSALTGKSTSPLPKSASNFVPKTPPPSPSCGPSLMTPVSGLVDNVMRRLSLTQSSNAATTQSVPPGSGEIRLNYASLDLPPVTEDESKSTKLKKLADDEPKEVGLTYAQIDFSPVRQKPFQEPESSLSHL